jgi:hypothetical protein
MFQIGQKVFWHSTGGNGLTYAVAATIQKIGKRVTIKTEMGGRVIAVKAENLRPDTKAAREIALAMAVGRM